MHCAIYTLIPLTCAIEKSTALAASLASGDADADLKGGYEFLKREGTNY